MGENFNPKVSIIIPVYNGADYIQESIQSALDQTYQNLEILVVNDGSTDDGKTEQAVRAFGDQVSYYRKQNGGVSSALNYGVERMTGDYFSWLSHDDKYEATKVQDAVNLLYQCEERACVVAFTSGYYIDSESKKIKNFPVRFEAGRLYDGCSVIEKMLRGETLNGCCMLIPRSVFIRCGGFDEGLRYNQDAVMWHKTFLSGYHLITDNKPNVMYRLHRNQTSKLRRDLYLHDTIEASKVLIPLFAQNSTREHNLLFFYARRVAISNCLSAVQMCIDYGKQNDKLSAGEIVRLRGISIYGCVRNIVRTIRNRMIK